MDITISPAHHHARERVALTAADAGRSGAENDGLTAPAVDAQGGMPIIPDREGPPVAMPLPADKTDTA